MWLLTLSCLLIIAILVCIILLILVCIIWVIIGYIIVIISWSSVRIWGTIIRVIICVLIRIRFLSLLLSDFCLCYLRIAHHLFIWVFLTLIRYFWSSLLLSLWLFRAIPPNIAIAPRIRMAAISGNKIFMKPPFSYLLIGHCTDCFD